MDTDKIWSDGLMSNILEYNRNLFYNCNGVLGFKWAKFIFTVSMRSNGKSFDWKCYVIHRWLNHDEKTVWLRREKVEISKEFLMDWWGDIKYKWEDKVNFVYQMTPLGAIGMFEKEVENDEGEIVTIKEVFIYFVSLKSTTKRKSGGDKQVRWIVFDEFILNPFLSGCSYLKGEGKLFNDLYDTYGRARSEIVDGKTVMIDPDVKCIFLGNTLSIANPMFTYYGIGWGLDSKRRFHQFKDKHILVEFWTKKEFIDFRKSTTLGQNVEGTEYGRYATEGEFLCDNQHIIGKKSSDAKHQFNVLSRGVTFGVWFDFKEQMFYISRKLVKNKIVYAVEKEEHNHETVYLSIDKGNRTMKEIFKAFCFGRFRCDSQENYQAFCRMLEVINR